MSTPGEHGSTDLAHLLRAMDPVLDDSVHVVVTGPPGLDTRSLRPFATVAEHEGTTVILDRRSLTDAIALGCGPEDPPPMVRITLQVHSSLLAVGLTAAVATALAAEGISCNVVAGHFHDHLLVPVDRGRDALEVLRALRSGPAG